MHYIWLDVHKKTISYCVKSYQEQALERGTIASTRTGFAPFAIDEKSGSSG